MTLLQDTPTWLAWTFTDVLPGTFKRAKAAFAHHDYPILAPLPPAKASTRPLEGHDQAGPFIYFVVDRDERVCYVGKCNEKSVIKRWVRPGVGGPASHYWTHSTASGGNVFNIAAGLRAERGPFHLRFTTLRELRAIHAVRLGIGDAMGDEDALAAMEAGLIRLLSPAWNR